MEITEQAKRGNPNWKQGQSANPAGRENKAQRRSRIERIISGWAEPFGGLAVLKPAELHLATIAAELSLRQPRRHEDMVRQGTLISRLLAQCGLATRTIRSEPVAEYVAPAPLDRAAFDAMINDAMAKARASRGET